jgi:hypothetical protein
VVKEEDDEDEEEDEGEGGGGAAVPTERAGWDGTVIHGPSALETSAEDAHPDEGEEEGAGELLSVRGRLVTASMPDMLPHHIGRGFLLRDWTLWTGGRTILHDTDGHRYCYVCGVGGYMASEKSGVFPRVEGP